MSRNCRATFAYGYGNYFPSSSGSSGSSDAALIIGGVAVAAGLAAILSRSGRQVDTAPAVTGVPARIDADPAWVAAAARPALQQCLNRAAKDVGLTGGNRIVLQSAEATALTGGLFHVEAQLTASYPDGSRLLSMECEATAAAVDHFDFVS